MVYFDTAATCRKPCKNTKCHYTNSSHVLFTPATMLSINIMRSGTIVISHLNLDIRTQDSSPSINVFPTQINSLAFFKFIWTHVL